MIILLSTRTSGGYASLKPLTHDWRREMRSRMQELTYREVLEGHEIPPATVILSDFERLDEDGRAGVAEIEATLRKRSDLRVVNSVHRALGRLELVQALSQRLGTYRSFPATEIPADLRFPVFVRSRYDHNGALSALLHSRAEVEAAVRALVLERFSPSRLLVVEFVDTKSPDGVYRKYGVYTIGGRLVPHHLMHHDHWMVKVPCSLSKQRLREEREFLFSTQASLEEIGTVFEIAGIEYGRVDYSYLDGKLVVWEINTNPKITLRKRDCPLRWWPNQTCFTKLIAGAFCDLDRGSPQVV